MMIPRPGYELLHAPNPAGIECAARFQPLLDRVWQMLPIQAQQPLARRWFWRKPEVTLTERIVDGQPSHGSCCFCGAHLYFSPRALDWPDDALVLALIAHELAHAVQAIDGTPPPQQCERATDSLASSWGFDMARLRAYVGGYPDEDPPPLPTLLPPCREV